MISCGSAAELKYSFLYIIESDYVQWTEPSVQTLKTWGLMLSSISARRPVIFSGPRLSSLVKLKRWADPVLVRIKLDDRCENTLWKYKCLLYKYKELLLLIQSPKVAMHLTLWEA